MKILRILALMSIILSVLLASCQPASTSSGSSVLAVESFLADIAQNIAGDRLKVDVLVPQGIDPHAFEPAPQDIARIEESRVIIINGGGLESWLNAILADASKDTTIITASQGLALRQPGQAEQESDHPEGDPHFWFDPNNAIVYVENIRDGLIQSDPQGKAIYTRNAADYSAQLAELDAWITEQVAAIPIENRLLVTNHESFGYFADRYGFRIVGTVIPSVSSEAAPSAQQMTSLVEAIRSAGVKAIFLETGANVDLANEIGSETGAKVISDLYTHSLSAPDGPAASYIAMMKYNTTKIVEALR